MRSSPMSWCTTFNSMVGPGASATETSSVAQLPAVGADLGALLQLEAVILKR